MWDLMPPPRTEPAPPALEAGSLNHWTAREVPFKNKLEKKIKKKIKKKKKKNKKKKKKKK